MATRKEYDGYDAATSITSNDLIKYKDGTSGKVYKITEANLSAQVNDDLFDNDAVTTSTVASDLVPIEQCGTKAVITPKDLYIQMKGYKEYTFAIRQSGISAPTISVIKDDFGLVTPLTATRENVGVYYIDITNLNVSMGINLNISGSYASENAPEIKIITAYLATDTRITITSGYFDSSSGYSPKDGYLTDLVGFTVKIMETLS